MCHLAFQDVDYITVQTMHSGKSTDFSIDPNIGPHAILKELWAGWYYVLQQEQVQQRWKLTWKVAKLYYFYLPKFLFQNK